MDYEVLVRQSYIKEAIIKGLKQELDKLKRQILGTKEARQHYNTLSNVGGTRTDKSVGVTFEVKKKHDWDQAALHTMWYQHPDENLPPFLTRSFVYKVNMTQYKEWAVANPSEAARMSAALSTVLADPSIKSINPKKEEEDESIGASD